VNGEQVLLIMGPFTPSLYGSGQAIYRLSSPEDINANQ
jgi:hypothetical protein